MEVTYLGRTFCCDHFRTWIFGKNDTKKLVESWEEYQDHINSGDWFATEQEAEVLKEDTPATEAVIIKIKGRKKGGR